MPKKQQPDPRRRLGSLYTRWGVKIARDEEFQNFQRRVMLLLDGNLNWKELGDDGTQAQFRLMYGDARFSIRDFLQFPHSLSGFMVVLQQLFWALKESASNKAEVVLGVLREAKRLSPGIDFGIAARNGVITFYPEGAKELDLPLVEEPLVWLSEYPKIAEHYEEALRIVLTKDSAKFRNALDNLRWALEQLMRSILGNRRPLEKQRDVLLPWMKQRNVHQQVVNMYSDLLNRFGEYQNDAVKHGDNWRPAELEFMIYLTGAFIRLLLQATKVREEMVGKDK
jgi:hypothetical protein